MDVCNSTKSIHETDPEGIAIRQTSDQIYETPEKQPLDPNTAEAVETVQSAVNSLDEKHRLPILLVSMEGLSVDEAAQILELPRGTLLSRLHRARQKLKDILLRDDVNLTKPKESLQ